MAHKILIATGGGDCPGLNAVIRGIVKRASLEKEEWKVYGCIESFNGILKDDVEIVELTESMVSGLHVKGGTIIKTTNKGGPFHFPVRQPDGSWVMEDRSMLMKKRFENMGFDAIVNVGGDGSQSISLKLQNMGIPVVGVPKTIDNDLSSTDFTFGFQTAVQIATEVSTSWLQRQRVTTVSSLWKSWDVMPAGLPCTRPLQAVPMSASSLKYRTTLKS